MAIEAPDVDSNRLGAFIGEATFVAADPPRDAAFALWRPMPGFAPPGRVRVAVHSRGEIRNDDVPAALVPVADAVPWLARNPGRGTRSLLAWRAAVRAGIALVARGRLRPWISPAGFDCWTIGPLDAEDEALLESLAAALPAEAHALLLEEDASRITSPAFAIRACWNAIADVLPRTAAASVAFGGPLYADWTPRSARAVVPSLLPPHTHVEGAHVRLRVELPIGAGAMIALAGLEPQDYAARVALHRGARRWQPLARVICSGSAGTTPLTEAELDELLTATPALSSLGVEVALPELQPLEMRAVVGSEIGRTEAPAFSLDSLLEFRWELAAGPWRLNAREVEELARSQHRLVRLRDRWLSVEPGLAQLARRKPPKGLRVGEALAAALTGRIQVGGHSLVVRATGRLEDLRARLIGGSGPREDPEPPELAASLRGYQRRGLAWLRDMCEMGIGGCLADDMGLGKTIQVIALHLARKGGAILVVCPASVLGNWEREFRSFAPNVPVRRYHGGIRGLDGLASDEVVLTTYGVLRRDGPRLAAREWDLIVADEAQHVKNPASAGARELRRLQARARLALTGTPVENRLLDLWAILDWTTPGLLGSRKSFQSWAAPVERGDDEAAETRLKKLLQPFVMRRRKSDPGVAPELPAKTETDHLVALTREQVGLYEAVVRETMAAICDSAGMKRRGLVLKLMTMLKQICNHPAQYLRQDGPLSGRSGKLEALDELLDLITAAGDSTLVFTQYVGMGRLLERHLGRRYATAFLHGSVPLKGRDQMVGRFQAGEVPVFLISLRAGGFGLNLSQATHVVHFDRWWNPAVEDQATDRAHRIGQTRPVQVHRVVTEGTVEDRIGLLLAHKRGLAARVTGGGEAWLSELSDQDLGDLVQLQHLP